MRFVTYLHDSEIKLGAQLNDWIVDLWGAQKYLLGNKYTQDGQHLSNVLTPELLSESSDPDSPFMAGARQTIKAIQDSLPKAAGMLISKAILFRADQITLKPPLLNPGKIICVGMNYPSPGLTEGQWPAHPVLFLKSSSTLTGHRQPIILPRVSDKVFCEGELAIVIGRRGKHITLEESLSYVAGYTIANDVGARDLEQRTSQWATGKLCDTFCPMGPALVTTDEIPDPNRLLIRTHINRQLVQSGNTNEMIFSVTYLVSYISAIATLEQGDIILTGSPKSIDDRPAPVVYLKPGDEISIEIGGIGVLSNQTVQEEYPDA
jgi:2-keto-4-pentenoate hydratase/2-oxohepta-3-ene-1,7-dioic acid hydratase in catechol pathway